MNGHGARAVLSLLLTCGILIGCRAEDSRPRVLDTSSGGRRSAPEPAEDAATDLDSLVLTLDQVASGLDQPLLVTGDGDDDSLLYVAEKSGRIRVLDEGVLRPEPFLDLSGAVSTQSERGLLGVAFSPTFSSSRTFYVNYTDRNGTTVISRFRVAGSGATGARRDSEEVLLRIEQPYPNHNGGCISFDPTGMLMIGTGDGGSGGDPQGNAQDAHSLLGKLLRIDVGESGRPALGEPYGVPADNPWARAASEDDPPPEVWALGLRNPWRFSFDTSTGDLWIGDVGQNAYEEVNVLKADGSGMPAGGANFGWNLYEGDHTFPDGDLSGSHEGMSPPIVEYPRASGSSVTSGFVYRGAVHETLRGIYLYGDFGSGRVWGLAPDGDGYRNRELLDTGYAISSFGADQNGELYLVDFGGTVYRVGTE